MRTARVGRSHGPTSAHPVPRRPRLADDRRPAASCLRKHSSGFGVPWLFALSTTLLMLLAAGAAWAQTGGEPAGHAGGEASLVVPPLNDPGIAPFFGVTGAHLLMIGLIVCLLGM